MTVLHLAPLSGTRVEAALATIERATLARRAGCAYAEVRSADVAEFIRSLALAGIAAAPCELDLAPPPGSVIARASDLRPVAPGIVELDLVHLERVPLGRATREALRQRLWGVVPAGSDDREHCRGLLHGENAIFAWSRRAWGSRAALRSEHARRAFRPMVFTRRSTGAWDLAGRTTVQRGDLAKWLFA